MTASELRFSHNRYGKPFLHLDSCEGEIRFNVFYSRGLALFVFARNKDVGIDVQSASERLGFAKIADRFFSREEIAMINALHPGLQRAAFYTIWTRKEACIKAFGTGLSYPSKSITVSGPPDPAATLVIRDEFSWPSAWTAITLPVAGKYHAALAAAGETKTVRFWQLSAN